MAKQSKNVTRVDIDTEELAISLCGMNETDDHDINDIDNALMEKFQVGYDDFDRIVRLLFPLIDIGVSPLTNDVFIGWADKSKGLWLAKKEISSEFMGLVIQWGTEGNPPEKMGAGFLKQITVDGKPEYDVTIQKSVFLDMEFLNDPENRGQIFTSGVCCETAIHNEDIRWIAKVGSGGNDWAIYYGSVSDTKEHIKAHGIKVFTKELIRKLVPCSDEALARYRH